MSNLQTVIKWQPWKNGTVKTGPGCFAYPDMLEVAWLAAGLMSAVLMSAHPPLSPGRVPRKRSRGPHPLLRLVHCFVTPGSWAQHQ